MPEFQLVRAAAEREAEKLMAEADAEDRDLADEVADVLLCVRHRLRIARSVRKHHAVETLREDFIRVRGGGIDSDVATFLRQMPEDVALDAEIVERNSFFRIRRRLVECVRTQGRHALHEIESAHRRRAPDFVDDGIDAAVVLAGDHSAHRAEVADAARQRARVDALNRGDAVAREVLGQRHLRLRVRRFRDGVADHESGHLRLLVLRDRCLDAVVTDVRIRHHHDLKSVRRIGGDLLISGQRRIENDLADRVGGGAKRLAVVHGSIFENEARSHLRRGLYERCAVPPAARRLYRRRLGGE